MDFDLMAPIDRLRRRAAGTLHPVISLGDPAPFAIAPSPMDKDWRERFDAMYPNVDVLPASLGDKIVGAARDRIAAMRQRLRDGLLAFGGELVCLPAWENDLEAIITRGQLFNPTGIRHQRGFIGESHANSAALWTAHPDRLLIATGYYLLSDGM